MASGEASGLRSAFTVVSGEVVDFDDFRGDGLIATVDGLRVYFHCTAIADGSRTIEVGARVRCTVVPGRLGRYEAADVAAVP